MLTTISPREWVLSALADPTVSFSVLVLGVLSIYVEFCRPGSVVFGACGSVLAAVAIYTLATSSNPRPVGALLLLAAALGFAASAFYPLRGCTAAASGFAMLAGARLLFAGPSNTRISLAAAIAITVPFTLITWFLTSTAARARGNKTLEQKREVVFSAPSDIFSTISGKTGPQGQSRERDRT